MRTSIYVETDKSVEVLSVEDLLYIAVDTTRDHFLCFTTRDKKYYGRGTLNDFEGKEWRWFFRCHRSVVVNLFNIKEINKYDRCVYFSNDEGNNTCPFSRRKYLPLRESLKEYLLT